MSPEAPPPRIRDIMVKNPVSTGPDDSLADAVSLMAEHRISALPIVDNRDRCVGVLSTTDILGIVRDEVLGRVEPDELVDLTSSIVSTTTGSPRYANKRVRDVMTSEVVTVGPEDHVVSAARELLRSRVHRLIVLDGNRKVLGIVSTLDLLHALSA